MHYCILSRAQWRELVNPLLGDWDWRVYVEVMMLFRTDDGISSTYIFLSSLGKDFKLGCQVSGGSIVVKRGMHAQTLLDSPDALSWLVVAQVCR